MGKTGYRQGGNAFRRLAARSRFTPKSKTGRAERGHYGNNKRTSTARIKLFFLFY
jgi:hypothetical protein